MIRHSLELAGADPAQMGVRLRIAGGQVRPRFVAEPQADDEVVDADGIRVFVARSIVEAHDGDIEIGVTPEHGQLVVGPL